MKGPAFLRGSFLVARHEFTVNLKSVRLIIMLIAFGLVVVGGAYGLSAASRGGGSFLSPLVVWPHAANTSTGENLAVVWVSNPFGDPLADRPVSFAARLGDMEEPLGEVRTDGEGFARLAVGNRTYVLTTVRSGTASFGTGVFFEMPPRNFTFSDRAEDLDNDGLRDDLGIHVLTQSGAPAAAEIFLNDTHIASVNARGYARIELPSGQSNVTVEVAGERETRTHFVSPSAPQLGFASGPDFVLFIIAGGFATFVLPIFAIAVTFDAISKERVQGTLDLLLSRPVSRIGTLLGKLTGTFAAVAVPVTLVNVVGIAIISAVSGKPPTGGFAAAFVGLSILLVAFYVLLQLTLSTLAKTAGTAILFGVLAFLAFNVLYFVITAVLSSVLFPRDYEGQFRFLQVAVLGNPSQIYQQLIAFAAPKEIGSGFGQFGGTTLDLPVVAVAALVWVTLLLALALWTFHRKAVE